MTAVFFSAFTSIYGFSAAVSPLPAGSTNLGTPLDSKNYTVQPDEATPSKPGKLQAV